MLKGKTPKPFEEAAAALAAGKVSDVVATDTGFYLVKLDQIARTPTPRSSAAPRPPASSTSRTRPSASRRGLEEGRSPP